MLETKIAWLSKIETRDDALEVVKVASYAFFFVPIAVGLMTLGSTVVSKGIWLLLVLVASAAVGLCLAGWLAQALARPASKEQP